MNELTTLKAEIYDLMVMIQNANAQIEARNKRIAEIFATPQIHEVEAPKEKTAKA